MDFFWSLCLSAYVFVCVYIYYNIGETVDHYNKTKWIKILLLDIIIKKQQYAVLLTHLLVTLILKNIVSHYNPPRTFSRDHPARGSQPPLAQPDGSSSTYLVDTLPIVAKTCIISQSASLSFFILFLVAGSPGVRSSQQGFCNNKHNAHR